MSLYSDQHIGEVFDRVHAVRFAGGNERVEPGQVLAGFVVANEEKILAAQCGNPQGSFRGIVINWKPSIGEKEGKRIPLLERVPDRFSHRTFGQMFRLLRQQQYLELVHYLLAAHLAHRQVRRRAENLLIQRRAFHLVDFEDEVQDAVSEATRALPSTW